MPRSRSQDKSVKVSLSLPYGMLNAVRDLADSHYGGNLSAYIQRLIENDMSGIKPDSDAADILDLLARHFRPALQPRLHECLAGANQQVVLDNLLEQIIRAIESDPGADPVSLRAQSLRVHKGLRTLCNASFLDGLFREIADEAGLEYPKRGMHERIAKSLARIVPGINPV